MAIREDEIAAKAMGINTRNMKLLAFGMGATFGGVSGAMFAAFQGFVSPESFALKESVMIVAMVVLGGIGHLPGVILGAVLLAALPEVLRYVAGPLQAMTDGRLDASILRQLFIALAMIIIMLVRPRGLWPSPEHGKSLRARARASASGMPAAAPGIETPADECPAKPRVPCRSIRERGEHNMTETVLNVSGISKRFGGLQALSDVGIKITRGQVYGLIGPNGAGKTTFFNVLTGLYTPDSGSFELAGKPYQPTAVHEVAKAGIARTFQNIRLFAEMTALENVMVGPPRAHALGRARRDVPHRRLQGRGGGDRQARAGTARLRGHRQVRRLQGAHAELRRPAPARDRPRAGHRPAADRARRACCRHERHREGACCAS